MSNQLKVEILIGLPGSGKTTYALQKVQQDASWVRINKDTLRQMCHASVHSKAREKFILQLRDQFILSALADRKNVIVDDTNFGPHVAHITELVKDKATVIVNDTFLQVPLQDCIKNDLKRVNSVGKDVIMRMHRDYIQPTFALSESPGSMRAIICDLDGTLCLLNGRNPYDASTCEQDLPNQAVLETLLALRIKGYSIILVSGRSDEFKPQTTRWLVEHEVPHNHLYMRKKGDTRPDQVIKREIYEQAIHPFYKVLMVLDDRQRVVDMWRSLGLTVFQVNYGDF